MVKKCLQDCLSSNFAGTAILSLCLLADEGQYDNIRIKKLVAFDIESLRIAKGMASYPAWSHKEVVSPTWQYGTVLVDSYDSREFKAKIKGYLFNSKEQVDMALDGSIADQRHQKLQVFQ